MWGWARLARLRFSWRKSRCVSGCGVDPIEHRCEIARRHGADHCLNPIGTDVGLEIKKLTGKRGADVIIETSGFADALQSALRGLAYGGTISYVAFAKPFAAGFNLGREAHFNNAKIVFSRACSEPNPDYPRWSRKRIEETCWELLMNGYLNCEDLIDPVVTFTTSPESYMKYVDQHPELSIKMGVTFKLRTAIMKIATQNRAFSRPLSWKNSNTSKRWDLMATKLMADCWWKTSTK